MNDIQRNNIEPLCRTIARNFNVLHALPSDWDFDQVIPYPRPLDQSSKLPRDFLDWIDVHVSTSTRKGLFESNEAQRGTNRPVTVTRRDLINLWRLNGGSICRVFGIQGI